MTALGLTWCVMVPAFFVWRWRDVAAVLRGWRR